MSNPNTPETFWARVAPPDARGCRVFRGCRHTGGYGLIRYQGVFMRAHRLAWVLAYGPIPDQSQVLHRCDTPPCCALDHLFLGDNGDNIRDKVQKDRQARGVRVRSARLTPDDVRAIRRRLLAGETRRMLAAEYGVSGATIARVATRRNWAHVPDEDAAPIGATTGAEIRQSG